MPTKGQVLVIYAGAFAVLLLTSIYEAVLQTRSNSLTLDLWFVLCFIVFLAVDVICEYRINDKNLHLLSIIIFYSGLVIFTIIAAYKFLILMGFAL